MATVLGIDLGSCGAIARLTEAGDLLEVLDMPILRDGPRGRPTVNPVLLAGIVKAFPDVKQAYVEFVGARPGEGPSGAFAFGRSRGVVEGVLGAAGIPATFVTPATWKRVVGIPPGRENAKDLARSEAIRRWPAHADRFARKMDDGRAEAGLIAAAGLMRGAKS